MNYHERVFQISIAEFALREAAMHAVSTKTFLLWMDGLESRLELQRRLADLPDCDEKRSIAAELDAKSSKYAASVSAMQRPLLASLARVESDHEKIEALIASLRASLPPPPS